MSNADTSVDVFLGPDTEKIREIVTNLYVTANVDPERLLALKAFVDFHVELLAVAISLVYREEVHSEIIRSTEVDLHQFVRAYSNQRGHK